MSNPKEIKKKVELNRVAYYETHLSLINCLLPVKMTPMEIAVLAMFMSLEGDIEKYRFKTLGRAIVRERLGLTPAGLSNYFRTLKDKGFLKEKGIDDLELFPLLNAHKDVQEYRFRLINNGTDPEHVEKEHDKRVEVELVDEDIYFEGTGEAEEREHRYVVEEMVIGQQQD